MVTQAVRGWDSPFERFPNDELSTIVSALARAVPDAGESQNRAWRESIPKLQNEVAEFVASGSGQRYRAVLEYELPLEFRRIDAVFLLRDTVVVIELKGKSVPSPADLDQAQAYARDLRAYHAECEHRNVVAVLVPTRSKAAREHRDGVVVCSPDLLDQLLSELDSAHASVPVDADRFLSEECYRPLPTLVRAARELFHTGDLRRVKRAAAATEPASDCLLELTRKAASTKTRKLILVAGVPGAGKTLVGLQLVHSHELDDLAVDRNGRRPTAPGVFLSGNGPLVEVLAYELQGAGGGGRTFVRAVKKYVQRYQDNPELTPPEHVLVYDEAQRAFDAAMVAETHDLPIELAKSEPELFVEFAQRIPEWGVVVALVGTGQEIHKGEEGGVVQWARAISKLPTKGEWEIHGPPQFADVFAGLPYERRRELSLDQSLRSHLAFDVHRYVGELVGLNLRGAQGVSETRIGYGKTDLLQSTRDLRALAEGISEAGHQFRITRDLESAKGYLRERYADDRHARYGIVASSRDRVLGSFGITNDWQSTRRLSYGPWYGDEENAPGSKSCRKLEDCVTEFGAQGLELDATLVGWGSDFLFRDGAWDISRAPGYRGGVARVRDPATLRANAYRVLLTRARDATIVFVPRLELLDQTYELLVACGFRELS